MSEITDAPILAVAPDENATALRVEIKGTKPPAQPYGPETVEFRYWCALDALRRGADFWAKHAELVDWQIGKTLPVDLDAGVDLNAYYDRTALKFFHDSVSGVTVFSGASPDVLCHELGHAVLDSIKPELWDAASDEIAAFHEAFGDISSILSALELMSFREAVLAQTGSKLYQSSSLSRLAEQLGWGIRQRYPDAVDPDCLRNAVNKFVYASPLNLPHDGPNSSLSSEPHSFSRVFSGAFFEAFASMFDQQSSQDEASLLETSRMAGELLVYAVKSAPVLPEFYSQVAIHMVEGAQNRFAAKFANAIKGAFVRRGILSLETASLPLDKQAAPTRHMAVFGGGAAAAVAIDRRAKELPLLGIAAQAYGLEQPQLFVRVPGDTRVYSAAPAALNIGVAKSVTPEDSAKSFVEDLFRRGEVDVGKFGNSVAGMVHLRTKKTHRIIKEKDHLILSRMLIDCT